MVRVTWPISTFWGPDHIFGADKARRKSGSIKEMARDRHIVIHTTNRKYHIAYLFLLFSMTLDDLEGHSPNWEVITCNSTNIYHGFNWHGASHGPSAVAELLVLICKRLQCGAKHTRRRSLYSMLSTVTQSRDSRQHTVPHADYSASSTTRGIRL